MYSVPCQELKRPTSDGSELVNRWRLAANGPVLLGIDRQKNGWQPPAVDG